MNKDYDNRPRAEPIWELTEMLASKMLEFADGLREAYHAIEAFAGHESLDTTRRYCEPSLGELQEAAELVSEEE